MFIRYITDEDVFANGFTLNPLTNETFSKTKINHEGISTYMQIWSDINSYNFRVLTDREGIVEDGKILTKQILAELVEEFFENDIDSFFQRNIPKKYSEWNQSKQYSIINYVMKLNHEEKCKMLNKFFKLGETHEA